jgi:hypothetical protein
MPSRTDIPRLDVTVVDAEIEDQADLGDEQEAEEEGEAAQRFLAAFLERDIVDLVDGGAERVERRSQDDAGENRIDAERGIDEIGGIGAENDEGRVGDVDNVENAERQRYAGRDRRVEAADQDAGDDGVDQKIE